MDRQKQSGQIIFESLILITGIALIFQIVFLVLPELQKQFQAQQIYKD